MEEIECQLRELEEKRLKLIAEKEHLNQPITRAEVKQLLSELKSEILETLKSTKTTPVRVSPPVAANCATTYTDFSSAATTSGSFDKQYSILQAVRASDDLKYIRPTTETPEEKLIKLIAERDKI